MTRESAVYLQQRKQGRLDESAGGFPRVVLIDTVSFCNLKCSMCFHSQMARPRGYMAEELFVKIIDEIAATDPGIRVWMVFFGEALITRRQPDGIFHRIRYAKERGLTDVVLNSNANLLDEAAADALIGSKLDAIYIGIDAFLPETYEKIRVGGDYTKVVKNVKHLLRLRDQKASPLQVYVQFVEMEENSQETQLFIDFWTSHGAQVKIRPKVSWAGKVEASNLVLGQEERWPCYWAMQSLSVTDRGQVVACAVDLDARFVAGDANTSTLAEIWNGPLADFRRKHREARWDELPVVCRDCRDWQSARADFYSQLGGQACAQLERS
ncbi:MAG: radical SAM/SPASM domain-containing protein [Vulcanimicrobiota bacterium]